MVAASELPINRFASANQMAQEIFGDGVIVQSASYTGDNRSSGIFSDGLATSPGVVPGDTGVILSTGRVQDFTNSNGQANQSGSTSRNTSGVNNDAQFNALAGANTYDASILDVDFIPDSSVMSMQFVFASEEYPEYVNSAFQDIIGVWINGAPVDLAVGNGDTDPGNINAGTNQNLFINNVGSPFNTEMDGFTVTLTLTIPVLANQLNSIRIGIADVADSSYDSHLLIAGDSVQTALVANTDTSSTNPNGTVNIDVLSNDIGAGTLTITHINGQPVVAGSTITLPTGQMVTLNANGTLTMVNDADTGTISFTYTVDNGSNTDVGFVNVDSVPCFAAGTPILTPDGEVLVEHLKPGDLVETLDDGAQPLRWVGERIVAARGEFAPIHIRAGTFGPHRDIYLSPLHRVLLRDHMADLLFGEAEILVAARDLIDGQSITRREGGWVSYFHFMFDRHQVVFSGGLESESFLPGPQTTELFDEPTIAQIKALFPGLDPSTGQGYSPAARRVLRRFEAEMLFATRKAA